MEEFVMVKGESSATKTMFQVKQAVDLINHFSDEAWWDRTSQCVGDLIGDPNQEVNVQPHFYLRSVKH